MKDQKFRHDKIKDRAKDMSKPKWILTVTL